MQKNNASGTLESITREGLHSYEATRFPHVSGAGKKQTTLSFPKRSAVAAGMDASEAQAKRARDAADANARYLAWLVANCWVPRTPKP